MGLELGVHCEDGNFFEGGHHGGDELVRMGVGYDKAVALALTLGKAPQGVKNVLGEEGLDPVDGLVEVKIALVEIEGQKMVL